MPQALVELRTTGVADNNCLLGNIEGKENE
jgi:hypothetical protein